MSKSGWRAAGRVQFRTVLSAVIAPNSPPCRHRAKFLIDQILGGVLFATTPLQYLVVQRRDRYRSPKSNVLRQQLLETARLVDPRPIVFRPPPVEGLPDHTCPAISLGDRVALG